MDFAFCLEHFWCLECWIYFILKLYKLYIPEDLRMEFVSTGISSGCDFLDPNFTVLSVAFSSCISLSLFPSCSRNLRRLFQPSRFVFFAEESSMQIGLGRKCTWAIRLLPFSVPKLTLLAHVMNQKSLFLTLGVMVSVRITLHIQVNFRTHY